MWPVSFSAVKKKLKEYGKKKKKDTGLDFLEYGSESEPAGEFESEPEPDNDPQLMEEYPLPPLPLKRPSSYDECHSALRSIDDKVQEALSSPSRARYKVITESTGVFLMRGSLHEMEVAQARAGAIQTHKRKLNARKSLGKGGSILARDALQKIKDKRRQEADDKLKRAKKAITVAENKAKNALRDRGVQARKDEKARQAFIKANPGLVGIEIPDSMWVPIRDPQKSPTAAEEEALRANQSLYEALERAQQEWNESRSEDPADFTAIPIDPTVLDDERQFQVRQRLDQVVMEVDSEEYEEEGSDVESPLPSPLPLAGSMDLIAGNADYVALE
ncbi:hypothetical protein V8E54_007609 [Elaphomyces granulatus]